MKTAPVSMNKFLSASTFPLTHFVVHKTIKIAYQLAFSVALWNNCIDYYKYLQRRYKLTEYGSNWNSVDVWIWKRDRHEIVRNGGTVGCSHFVRILCFQSAVNFVPQNILIHLPKLSLQKSICPVHSTNHKYCQPKHKKASRKHTD